MIDKKTKLAHWLNRTTDLVITRQGVPRSREVLVTRSTAELSGLRTLSLKEEIYACVSVRFAYYPFRISSVTYVIRREILTDLIGVTSILTP